MAEELAFVLINPYTIRKSRTGGVLGRLLRRPGLDLIATRMFAPGPELVKEFTEAMGKDQTDHPEIQELILQYVREKYAPNPQTGERRRVMFLLFKGENAVRRLREEVVGHITRESATGETIRDTFADFIKDRSGKTVYFEPAVLIATDRETVKEKMLIWARYAQSDGGLLENVVRYTPGKKVEKTLVLLKPDNFQWPSSRVGNIIDNFSRAGLFIIGIKVVRMSVEMAQMFYQPVREMFAERFKTMLEDKIKRALATQFEFTLPDGLAREVTMKIKDLYAENEFSKIIKFMTGSLPADTVTPEDRKKSGREKCLAVVYQGENAVQKIRDILGSTDPGKAAPATVRKEFGKDVMVNTAHASDSVQNAEREIGILDIGGTELKETIENYYR